MLFMVRGENLKHFSLYTGIRVCQEEYLEGLVQQIPFGEQHAREITTPHPVPMRGELLRKPRKQRRQPSPPDGEPAPLRSGVGFL